MGLGEPEGLRIALFGEFVDHGAAGIGEPHHFGTFIEGFARGVVDGRADDLHFERRVHLYDLGVTAAHQQAEERKVGVGELPVGEIEEVREDVSLQMVDLHHRDVAGDGEPFGEGDAHHERPEQAGAAREGDGVELVGRDARLLQGGVDHGDDVLLVGPGGEFGNHAPVLHVDGLRRDDVGQQYVVADHGGRGVVARRLDA